MKARIRISDGEQVVAFGTIEGGRVESSADLGDGVYEAIEAAIERGESTTFVDGDFYRWWIEE